MLQSGRRPASDETHAQPRPPVSGRVGPVLTYGRPFSSRLKDSHVVEVVYISLGLSEHHVI